MMISFLLSESWSGDPAARGTVKQVLARQRYHHLNCFQKTNPGYRSVDGGGISLFSAL